MLWVSPARPCEMSLSDSLAEAMYLFLKVRLQEPALLADMYA